MNVLAVAANHDEAAVAVVLDRLRVDLGAAQLLGGHGNALAVGYILSVSLGTNEKRAIL